MPHVHIAPVLNKFCSIRIELSKRYWKFPNWYLAIACANQCAYATLSTCRISRHQNYIVKSQHVWDCASTVSSSCPSWCSGGVVHMFRSASSNQLGLTMISCQAIASPARNMFDFTLFTQLQDTPNNGISQNVLVNIAQGFLSFSKWRVLVRWYDMNVYIPLARQSP